MTVLDLETCFCGRPATTTLCAIAYCHGCAETILAPIRRRVAERDGIGFGEQHGPLRPDWGPTFAELKCCLCGATWVGPIGEQCSWCVDALEHLRQWQAEILLRPELPDADDPRYADALAAWMARLERGVHAELITESQALAAAQRQTKRVA